MAINFPSTAGQATDGSYTYNVAGLVYSWDGTSWSAAGAGASATDRTLFSVTQNAAGSTALSYNSNTGVFSYTPPDLSGYLTAEADTLATVTGRGAVTTNTIQVGRVEVGSGNLSIDDVSGNLELRSNTGVVKLLNSSGLNSVTAGGDVFLYSNNVLKLNTTNAGVTVSGNLTTTGSLTAGGLTYPTSNGTSGQTLTSDGLGNVYWSNGGLQARATVQVTQSISNNAAANVSFTTPKTYALLKIETSHAAWVTLYTDTTSRTNDASRTEDTDPTPGSGVLTEVITTGSVTQLITPGTICFNSTGSGTTYGKIVNKSGSTTNVTVTLTYVQLEA